MSASFAYVLWTSRAKDEGEYEGPDSDPSALGFFFFFILFPPWVRSASYSEEFPLSYVLTVP